MVYGEKFNSLIINCAIKFSSTCCLTKVKKTKKLKTC